MRYLLGLFACLMFAAAWAQQPANPHADVLQTYAKQMDSVQTLTSRFTEEKHLSLLSQPLQSSGIFSFDKNARQLRWQYQKPFANGFLIEADKVYRLQQGEKKPVRQALERMFMAEMLAWLTLDFDALQKNYNITPNGPEITFTPRNDGHKIVREIVVWLDEKDARLVTRVRLTQPSGDFIVWKFDHTQLNPPCDKECP